MTEPTSSYLLAFDTANETIAIGIGALDAARNSVRPIATREAEAHRASNTQLLARIDELLVESGIEKDQIACVVCGRGPGSFTGVRIAMATAKGIAMALEVPLYGISTLDAVAWGLARGGVRGQVLVAADAMRKEVYPVRYRIEGDEGAGEGSCSVVRLDADSVVKAADAPAALGLAPVGDEGAVAGGGAPLAIAGDALKKYADVFAPYGAFSEEALWTPTGLGLLLASQAAWRAGEIDPFDAVRGNPAFALPVYTRLSDAEENERIRLSKNEPKNLRTGVQDAEVRRDQRAVEHDPAIANARPDEQGVVYRPLDAACAARVAELERRCMGTDAWSEALVLDELPRKDRIWWAAFSSAGLRPAERLDAAEPSGTPSSCDCAGSRTEYASPAQSPESGAPEGSSLTLRTTGESADSTCGVGAATSESANSTCGALAASQTLVGYAGGWVVDGQVQILKVAVAPEARRRGIARGLLARVASDARDLGAQSCSLEVRASNAGARALYEALGLHEIGVRPRYYSDREDAVIMEGPLPLDPHDVAGMHLQEQAIAEGSDARPDASAPAPAALDAHRPLILAIESSCDETAAAVVDGSGALVSDVVASQIDFHARFGGVVPEIASRKHIEAICGVAEECLAVAARRLGVARLRWRDLDAVGVTYAPGLVGALVVGVAFAKGAAWAADLPFIGVNHMEGHLYANKIATPDITPPMVVSLVSGGHTMLVHVKAWGEYVTLGSTIDDAVGEAFDKVAKALGLGYPGGPVISKLAAEGNPRAIAFPRALLHSHDLRFSLSGLKTAVITYIQKERAEGRPLNLPDIAASFQQAVIDVQVAKARTALEMTGAREFCLGGGVAANPALRAAYEQMCADLGVRLTMPPLSACGDNAGMIALVALDRFRQGKFFGLDADAQAHATLDEPY